MILRKPIIVLLKFLSDLFYFIFILLIRFYCEGYFKRFPVIKYTYVACLIDAMWFFLALHGLIVFYGLPRKIYSEPCHHLRESFCENNYLQGDNLLV